MSKFIDKLVRIYKTSAPPLGFRKATEDVDIPSMALIADITKATVKKAKSISGDKVDAAIVNSAGVDTDRFNELKAALDTLPLGVFISENSEPDHIGKIIKLDWDFIAFGLQTPLEIVSKEEKGKILIIEPSTAPALVRTINELNFGIDGIFIANNNPSATVGFLLTCQLFTSLINKPLLVNLDSSISSDGLSNLHAAGVKGLILTEGMPPKSIVELKKEISGLPKTNKRKTGRGAAVLPHIGLQTEASVEKVEEEDDDDGEDI